MHNKHPHLAHSKYRPDIDGLRAVAILSVVIFHAFPENMPGGFIGVDIFFVISGFLISTIIFSSLERDRFSLFEFYVRRIRRIFPALILVLVACLALGLFVLFPSEYKQLGKHTAAGAGFIQNIILWREGGYFESAAETKPLLHLWSLAIEEQFYILWPLLLAFVWKRHWSFLKITAIIAAASFAVNIYLMHSNPTAAFFLPMSRFWELMIGGVLAFISLHRSHFIDRHKNGQSILGFVLILAGLLFLNKGLDFPGWWALLPTLGAFFVISAGPNAWLNEKLLANKLMVWIGLISYPLYLWHWPIFSYLRILERDDSKLEMLGALVSAVFLAWLTYRFVEKPFRSGGNSRVNAIVLFAIIVSIGIFGAFSFKSERFHGEPLKNLNRIIQYDFASGYRLGTCFLYGEPNDKFSDICDGINAGKPTVVIWGDSHAASMYRGLLKQSTILGFNLAQYNSPGCPPVLNFDVDNRAGCKSYNTEVLNKIRIAKPDTVILAGYWLLYDGKHYKNRILWNRLSDEKLSDTLLVLKSFGIRNVVVIGQLPTFSQSQTKIGRHTFVQDVKNRTFSDYIYESNTMDNRIRNIAKNNNITFISPIDTLCNNDGCLISTSLKKFTPLAWDYGHLTTDGSEYFIESALLHNVFHLPVTH